MSDYMVRLQLNLGCVTIFYENGQMIGKFTANFQYCILRIENF